MITAISFKGGEKLDRPICKGSGIIGRGARPFGRRGLHTLAYTITTLASSLPRHPSILGEPKTGRSPRDWLFDFEKLGLADLAINNTLFLYHAVSHHVMSLREQLRTVHMTGASEPWERGNINWAVSWDSCCCPSNDGLCKAPLFYSGKQAEARLHL